MNNTICEIYDKRPQICRDFPTRPENIRHFDKCTFKFDEKGIRSGECCACGQCCVNMPWPIDISVDIAVPEIEIRKDEETNEVIRDGTCRFLDNG